MALVGHWPLNGTLEDFSGYKNTARLGGFDWVPGKIEQSARFNGNGHHFFIDNNRMFEDVSLSFWFKWDGEGGGVDGQKFIFETNPDWSLNFFILKDGRYQAEYKTDNGEVNILSKEQTPIDKWTHVTITVDKTNHLFSLYLNGKLVGQESIAGTGNLIPINRFVFGSFRNANGRWFSGFLTDIRLYNHCLSVKEIDELRKLKILHIGGANETQITHRNYIVDPGTRVRPWSRGTVSFIDEEFQDYKIILSESSPTGAGLHWNTANMPLLKVGDKMTFSVWRYGTDVNNYPYLYIQGREYLPDGTIKGYDPISIHLNIKTTFYDEDGNELPRQVNGQWIKMVNIIENTNKNGNSIYLTNIYFLSRSYTEGNIKFAKPMLSFSDKEMDYVANDDLDKVEIFDLSGFNNRFIATGSIAKNPNSPMGTAFSINNSTRSYMFSKGFPKLTEEFTLSTWIRQDGYSSSGTAYAISTGRDMNDAGFNIYFSEDILRIRIGSANSNKNLKIKDNMSGFWFHLGLVYNHGDFEIYINGELELSDSVDEISYNAGNDALVIGKMAYNYTNSSAYFPFFGSIADTKIYATALSQEDIRREVEVKASMDNVGNVFISHIEQDVMGDRNLLQDNGNLLLSTPESSLSYDEDTGIYSLTSNAQVVTVSQTDLLIPLIQNKDGIYDRYRVEAEIRQIEGQMSQFYAFSDFRDKNRKTISYTSSYTDPATNTKLVKELKPGDTKIEVESTEGWFENGQDNYVYQKQIKFFPPGYPYPDYTYSDILGQYLTIEGNTIHLRNSWNGQEMPVGTPVSNTRSGNSYSYIGYGNLTPDWLKVSGITSPTQENENLRHGSTYLGIGFLTNRNVSETVTVQIRNIKITNLDRPQTKPVTFSFTDHGEISPNIINQIDHGLEGTKKHRIREDGTLEMTGTIKQG